MTVTMPPEWGPHTRTWMGWPPLGGYIRAADEGADVSAWAAVAAAVVDFEPVSMLVAPGQWEQARSALDPRVELVEVELDDAWLRDIGPTFVVRGQRELAAVDWTFNGWGLSSDTFEADAKIASFVAGRAGAPVISSSLVNEGGGICVDGDGTVIVTETVQLHDRRNPGWTKAQVEAELRATLGVSAVIWLVRGLTGDMQEFRPGVGTNGHVDVLAAFVRPGVVLVHGQPDPHHPDHAVMAENLDRLRLARDASGRPLKLITIDAPTNHVVDGVPIDHSYINFSFVNGGIVASVYGDPVADANALAILGQCFPERAIVGVDARPIFRNGGGVHCITQHEPALVGVPSAEVSDHRDR